MLKETSFKYLGFTVQEDGGSHVEVGRRVKGRYAWKEVTGVLCDKKLQNWVKGRLYTTMVRPGMTYETEVVALTKKKNNHCRWQG